MDKYGVDKFFIDAIEECDDSIINNRERYWIKYYNAKRGGYNITNGGDGQNNVDDIEKQRILAFWMNGLLINEICEKTGRCTKTVRRVLRSFGISISEARKRGTSTSCQWKRKPLYFYDLEGNFLRGYRSIREASNATGIHFTTLGHVLDGRQKSIHRMMIRDYKADKIEGLGKNYRVGPVEVHQYTLDGKYVNSYASYADAMKAVGILDTKAIRIACSKPNRTCVGHMWRLYKADRIEPHYSVCEVRA